MQAGSVFRNRYSLTGWRWRSSNAIWCGADQVEEPWGPVALKMYALTSDFIREKELLDMPYSSEHWPSRHHRPSPPPPALILCQPLAKLQSRCYRVGKKIAYPYGWHEALPMRQFALNQEVDKGVIISLLRVYAVCCSALSCIAVNPQPIHDPLGTALQRLLAEADA